jgi:molecular chaperone GrpE
MDETRAEQNQSQDQSTAGPPGVQEDLETLRLRAEERDKFLELLQRTQADFENYQKRNRRELELERKYALTPLARDLLPVLDNLERALAYANAGDSLAQGVRMVRSQLLDILRRHHIVPIAAEGQPFDPNQHEALLHEPSGEHPPGTVIRVLEPGYVYHDRVLRPAKVAVSRAPEDLAAVPAEDLPAAQAPSAPPRSPGGAGPGG